MYSEPYADWEAVFSGAVFMPAHIAAAQGGMSADGDGKALIDAITKDDTAALTPVGTFWSTGWDYQPDLPQLPDTALLPTSGPYKIRQRLQRNADPGQERQVVGHPGQDEQLRVQVRQPGGMGAGDGQR